MVSPLFNILHVVGQPVVLAHINGSLFPHVREELPATIGNLQALTVLNVLNNRLSGTCLVEPVRLLISVLCVALPDSIGNLQNLTKLHANSNALQGS